MVTLWYYCYNWYTFLRPPAYTFTAIFIHVQNPCKWHVSLCSSISKPYMQSNSMLFHLKSMLFDCIYGFDMLDQRETWFFQWFWAWRKIAVKVYAGGLKDLLGMMLFLPPLDILTCNAANRQSFLIHFDLPWLTLLNPKCLQWISTLFRKSGTILVPFLPDGFKAIKGWKQYLFTEGY